MTIVLHRRKFLLGIVGTGLLTQAARAQPPYCEIPPAPVRCFAECKNNTILATTCDAAANQCRSSCDVYHPGQAPAQVLDGLAWRGEIGGSHPTTPNELKQAIDKARGPLLDFIAAGAKGKIDKPGFYWALFDAPAKETPKFMAIVQAPPRPLELKPSELAIGFTATQEDVQKFQSIELAKMLSDAEKLVFLAHFG